MPKNRNFCSASRIFGALALFSAGLLMYGCGHEAAGGAKGSDASLEQLQGGVVGNWAEARGTREMLQFNADGTVQLDSPREHHLCKYDFPDSQHIRLNCAPPGAPAMSQIWKVEVTADKLMISDDHEVGTYRRK